MHNTPGDVEHKVPSSENRGLHFNWDNLSIACTECNRRKNDYWDSCRPFLDPYQDDVEILVVHLGPLVTWQPGSERAELTIRLLGLSDDSRMEVIFRKIEKIEEVKNLVERLSSVGPGALNAALNMRLVQMKEKRSEYSAMVISVCANIGF